MKQKVIVIDIDGVCLYSEFIFEEIYKLGLKGDDKWAYFDANCNSDKVELMSGIKQFLRSFGDNVVTVVSTARSERLRHQTAKKLWQYRIGFEEMYMRSINDYREAKEVKKEHLLQIMDKYDIVCFIDDDLNNCEMAKELGILALRRV